MAIIVASDRLFEAARLYAQLLGIVDEEFTLEIERKYLRGNVLGVCEYYRDDNHLHIQLERRRLGRTEDIYETLAHEMVHAKQYVTGELKEINPLFAMFKGNIHPNSVDGDAYWLTPWELEAYGKQKWLYYKWTQYNEGE